MRGWKSASTLSTAGVDVHAGPEGIKFFSVDLVILPEVRCAMLTCRVVGFGSDLSLLARTH